MDDFPLTFKGGYGVRRRDAFTGHFSRDSTEAGNPNGRGALCCSCHPQQN